MKKSKAKVSISNEKDPSMEETIGTLYQQASVSEFEHVGTVNVSLDNCDFAKLPQEERRGCVKHGDRGTATTGTTGCPGLGCPVTGTSGYG